MAAKCDICGKMTNKYRTTYAGDVVCYGICLQVYRLESYLLRMEERRKRDLANNQKAYQEAREMSAWLTLWKYGNPEQRRQAAKVISAW